MGDCVSVHACMCVPLHVRGYVLCVPCICTCSHVHGCAEWPLVLLQTREGQSFAQSHTAQGLVMEHGSERSCH